MRFLDCKTRKQATAMAPWAYKIIKVEGGYLAFATADDYKTAMMQK